MAAAVGVSINFATDLKTNLLAWAVVVGLVLASALVAVAIERRSRNGSPAGGAAITSSSETGSTSEAYGLVMRTTELTNPDGSRTSTVEFFNEEVAIQAYRQNFGSRKG